MRLRSASRPAPLVNPAPAAAPGAEAPPAYDASPFDISGGARLPGATLAERIAYLKAHAAYAPGPTSDETYLRLRVDGVSFRATLGEFSEPTPQFRLIIASDNGDECLWLALASDRASKVEYLSNARACPFYPMPEKKMGDYILTVIDKLCLSLGIPRSILRDRSHVPCSSVDGEVSLAALQVMKTGKTWYENRAYAVSGSLEEPISDPQRELLEQFRLVLMKTTLGELAGSEAYEPIAALGHRPDELLSKILPPLWESNCALYITIIKHILHDDTKFANALKYFDSDQLPEMMKIY